MRGLSGLSRKITSMDDLRVMTVRCRECGATLLQAHVPGPGFGIFDFDFGRDFFMCHAAMPTIEIVPTDDFVRASDLILGKPEYEYTFQRTGSTLRVLIRWPS